MTKPKTNAERAIKILEGAFNGNCAVQPWWNGQVSLITKELDEAEQRGRESRDEPSREEINAFLEPAPNCEVNWDEWDTGFREGAKWALNWRKK